MEKDYNNSFYGYNGYINRKNYAINLFILVALYVSALFVNWNSFFQYTPYKFLLNILLYLVFFFQFMIAISALSLVYRRLADITKNIQEEKQQLVKQFFAVIYVFPFLYLFCLKSFLNFYILDIISLLLFGVSALFTIILCFIKGK